MSDTLPRVMFMTRSFDRGGAQRQLVTLLAALKRLGWPVSAVCFYGNGALQGEVETAGVRVLCVNKRGRWDVFGFAWRLVRLIMRERPQIIHGYLPLANLLAALLRICTPETKVVWGVRNSDLDRSTMGRSMKFLYSLEGRWAKLAHLIVANSHAGKLHRVAMGFPEDKVCVIPNGTDTRKFSFQEDGRSYYRKKWQVPRASVLVGMVGRLEPVKDYWCFINAAALLGARSSCRFVCIGDGEADYSRRLQRKARELGLADCLVWAGACDDMPRAYSAMDILVSSSTSEGFSNVVAEAMACGRPCVVTDVGDSAAIVGETGVVVQSGAPNALAAGMEKLCARLDIEGDALRQAVRERIKTEFSSEKLAEDTAAALIALGSGHG